MNFNNTDMAVVANAIKSHNIELVNELASKDKIANLSNSDKRELLCDAIKSEFIMGIDVLLKNGASFCNDDNQFVDESILASIFNPEVNYDADGNHSFLNELINLLPSHSQIDEKGNSLLHYACIHDYHECLSYLVTRGVSINSSNNNGETPIFSAAFFGNLNYLKLLLSHGADINYENVQGETPLAVALQNHETNAECIEFLINNGADVNHVDEQGRIPLFYAAESCNRDIIKLLIDKGSNMNHSDNFGYTPISFAVLENNVEALSQLISRGADIHHIINEHEYRKSTMPILEAIELERLDCIKVFLENGIDLDFDYKEILESESSLNLLDAAKSLSQESADFIEAYFESRTLQGCIEDERQSLGVIF